MNNNSKILFENLKKLSLSSGTIVFSIGDHYIQFSKSINDDEIYFEAVSHNFLDTIPKKIKEDFLSLGFNLDDGNYFKKISISEIEIATQDSQKIFEDIYRVNYDKIFEIQDNIDNLLSLESGNKNTDKAITEKKENSNFLKTTSIIVILSLIGYAAFFQNHTIEKESKILSSEACIMSHHFVEEQLISPQSADFGYCDKSKIVYLGNDRYQVSNYVDASNAFGASLRHSYFVILKYKQGNWSNINNWELEKIEIK